jgi:hypothetical protein
MRVARRRARKVALNDDARRLSRPPRIRSSPRPTLPTLTARQVRYLRQDEGPQRHCGDERETASLTRDEAGRRAGRCVSAFAARRSSNRTIASTLGGGFRLAMALATFRCRGGDAPQGRWP